MNEIDKRREEYQYYLKSQNLQEQTVKNYIKSLDYDFPEKLGIYTVFSITSLNELRNISYKCNSELKEWSNGIGHHRPRASINQYIAFLEQLEQKDIYINKIKTIYKVSNQNLNSISTLNIKNIILYGSAGIGKTHNYQRLISMLEAGNSKKEIFDTITDNTNNEKVVLNSEIFQKIKDDNRVEFITFHQSYSYEDFIEGFRPKESGNIELEDGIFKSISEKARKNLEDSKKSQEEIESIKQKNFYIVIDEINRGNISKIFGELITLIEEDKRDMYEVTLPYSKELFKIPSNLYIIATMNSTDKSIATIDIALRRRFTFLKMLPNPNLVEFEQAKILMENLNHFIQDNLGEDYLIGHSYFMKIENDEDLEFIKKYKIKPLLEEYFYADDEKLLEAIKILNLN